MLEFDKNTTLIIGDNAQGKTNLLEAIYFLSSGRSHRTNIQDELIKFNSEFALIKADTGEQLIDIELRHGGKYRINIDKIPHKKKSDFVSIIPSVIFSPDDLAIIKGGPAKRRDFFDEILEKIQPDYRSLRLNYQKILNQRNSLLKSLNTDNQAKSASTIEAWDDNLIKYGTEIIARRLGLFSEFKSMYSSIMKNFFFEASSELFYIFSWERNFQRANTAGYIKKPGNENLILIDLKNDFKKIKSEIKEIFLKKLKLNLSKEINYKNTFTGPHRDDLLITFNNEDLRSFGSQGQQRVAAICLKFCELEIVREKLKKEPVLLLDDVLSELDHERERKVLSLIDKKFQTFITTSNAGYAEHISDITNVNLKRFLVKCNSVKLLEY